jgi:hypothetical protein
MKSTKYHFEDFTESHYKLLLKTAKKNYAFEKFGNKSKQQHIILRHDVDLSVHRSLHLAKIEKKFNISSTYFFQLRSEFYNIFEKPILSRINEITNLGHEIGLHFDLSFYKNKTRSEMINNLKREKKILSELLDREILVFSFHNPGMGNASSIEDYRLGGMINVYAKKFKQSYHYISDSNGYWRYLRLYDLLKKADKKRIQILIHPGWWQKTVMSPRNRVMRCIDERSKRTLETYDAILKESKRKNIH